MKMLFADLETTGLDPKKNGIVQLAGIFCDYDENKGFVGVQEEFNFLIRPFDSDEISEDALKIQGRTQEQIKTYASPTETYLAIKSMLGKRVDKYNKKDKMFFCGYNAKFDMDFLREFFAKNKDVYFGSWFFFPPIDVMLMAAVGRMYNRTELPDFKLGTVAQSYGIKIDGELHDALVDIKLTMQLFQQMMTE